MIVAGVIVVGGIGTIALSWSSLVETYDEMVAMAGEVAVDTGTELGRMSFHAVQCGNPELMDEMQSAMAQIDSTSDLQASVRTAFHAGIEEARGMDMAYSAEFCTELLRQIEEAQQ